MEWHTNIRDDMINGQKNYSFGIFSIIQLRGVMTFGLDKRLKKVIPWHTHPFALLIDFQPAWICSLDLMVQIWRYDGPKVQFHKRYTW